MKRTLLTAQGPAVTFPVGRWGSYWTRYKVLAAAGVNELTVTPHIHVWQWDEGADPTWYVSLDLAFDTDLWDVDRFGLVYGDPTFEKAVRAWWAHIGFAHVGRGPSYTEQGMQGDDTVSMEATTPEIATWSDLFTSAHTALAWAGAGPGPGWSIAVAQVDA